MATPAAAVSMPPVTALTLFFTNTSGVEKKDFYRTEPGQPYDPTDPVVLRLLDVGGVPVPGATVQVTIEKAVTSSIWVADGGTSNEFPATETSPDIPATAYFLDGGTQKATITLITDDQGWLRPVVVAGALAGSLKITGVVISIPGTSSKGQAAEAWLGISLGVGEAWSWGHGTSGQLGTGSTSVCAVPAAVALPSSVNAIKAIYGRQWWNAYHYFAVDDEDRVWAWGSDLYKTLTGGGMALTPREITSKFPAGLTVTQISVGIAYRAYALMSDGSVYGWGSEDGTRGKSERFLATISKRTPSTSGVATPVKIMFENNSPKLPARIIKIAAGDSTNYVLLENGEVWAWGLDIGGSFGKGTLTTTLNGVVRTNASKVTGFPADSPVVDIANSGYTPFAVTADGRVWSWGGAGHGLHGDGADGTKVSDWAKATQITRVTGKALRVYADVLNAGAVMEDGSAWVWGDNQSGQLGNGVKGGSIGPATYPVQHTFSSPVASLSMGWGPYAVLSDGTLMQWGLGQLGYTTAANLDRDPLRPTKVLGLPPGPVTQFVATHRARVAIISRNS